MIKAAVTKVQVGEGADARSILRPVAKNLSRLRFKVEQSGARLVVRAVDDFAGVSSGKYFSTCFDHVYLDYREEWKCEDQEALLFAIYIQIAVPRPDLTTVEVVGLHFQPCVEYERRVESDVEPSEDQKRWIRGPHLQVMIGTDLDRCHIFLGDDSRRRREQWGRKSVAKQMRSHLKMLLDQIYTYIAS